MRSTQRPLEIYPLPQDEESKSIEENLQPIYQTTLKPADRNLFSICIPHAQKEWPCK